MLSKDGLEAIASLLFVFGDLDSHLLCRRLGWSFGAFLLLVIMDSIVYNISLSYALGAHYFCNNNYLGLDSTLAKYLPLHRG